MTNTKLFNPPGADDYLIGAELIEFHEELGYFFETDLTELINRKPKIEKVVETVETYEVNYIQVLTLEAYSVLHTILIQGDHLQIQDDKSLKQTIQTKLPQLHPGAIDICIRNTQAFMDTLATKTDILEHVVGKNSAERQGLRLFLINLGNYLNIEPNVNTGYKELETIDELGLLYPKNYLPHIQNGYELGRLLYGEIINFFQARQERRNCD